MTKIIVDRYRQRPQNEYDIKRTYDIVQQKNQATITKKKKKNQATYKA